MTLSCIFDFEQIEKFENNNFFVLPQIWLKEPVKLIQLVKITHSFLHVISKLFHPIIFRFSR